MDQEVDHSLTRTSTNDSMNDGVLSREDGGMVNAVSNRMVTNSGGVSNQQTSLGEFTKRRNWTQRVVEELRDLLHILTPDGRISYVSPSCKSITGYEAHEFVGNFIGEYVHPDDNTMFMREFNEAITSAQPLRFFYRFKKEDGAYLIFECVGHPHSSADPSMNAQEIDSSSSHSSGICHGFFMMARVYPTKNTALLDSFLEHKMENEHLMRKIRDLRREEFEDNEEQERHWQAQSHSNNHITVSETVPQGPSMTDTVTDHQGMPPPPKPSITDATALTRQNLDSALSALRPDSIADKMSRYEGSSHIETIERLTGLRYRDGERSQGISTGDMSPALIVQTPQAQGDAGIALPSSSSDADGRDRASKKKIKLADEYVCADCGTLDSPEWRKGPRGPKTLCNACGLRWAKKEKKRDRPVHSDQGVTSTSMSTMSPHNGDIYGQ